MTLRRTTTHWLAILCVATSGFAGTMNYTVTLNADVCHEVRLGRFTVPADTSGRRDVGTDYCHPELRSAGETRLYLTAACHQRGEVWLPAPQKYAVDLNGPKTLGRISEADWERAPQLPWSGNGLAPSAIDTGIHYKGLFLERSGPRWAGVGNGPVRTHMSFGLTRAAVNSWDGFDVTYSFLDQTSFLKRDKVVGKYWIDIYGTRSGEALLRIKGSFHGAEPYQFQGQAAWYSERYYVIPIGGTMGNGEFSLRRLLICDIDAASGKSKTVLKERGNSR